jgi:hypothetical protein
LFSSGNGLFFGERNPQRLAEHLNHNDPVEMSHQAARPIEKIPHFQFGNAFNFIGGRHKTVPILTNILKMAFCFKIFHLKTKSFFP